MGFTEQDKNTTLKEFNNEINNPKAPRQHTMGKTKSDTEQRSGENEQQTIEKYKKKKGINMKFDRTTENSNVFSNVSFLSRLDFQEY